MKRVICQTSEPNNMAKIHAIIKEMKRQGCDADEILDNFVRDIPDKQCFEILDDIKERYGIEFDLEDIL